MNVPDYLDQGEVWIPKDGRPIAIEDMTPEWRRNAARWLIRRAEALRMECRIAGSRNDGTEDLVGLLSGISKPDEWVRRTALYLALIDGVWYDIRHRFEAGPVDPVDPFRRVG